MAGSREALTPKECRKKARDSRDLAEHTTNPAVRETLLNVAEAYDRFALELEQQQAGTQGPVPDDSDDPTS
jgi:hypothetical protein